MTHFTSMQRINVSCVAGLIKEQALFCVGENMYKTLII